MNLPEDQILQLAPDESSRKAGIGLANPAKWLSKGANETALWGECAGSGSKPYQTSIDLARTAFKCSCPSRKFPCKHGLGLLLLHARQPALFTTTEMPPWVAGWMAQRGEKGEKKAAPSKPVDEAGVAKRQQARETKVAAGMDDLLLWLQDAVRNGILAAVDKKPAYWEATARRLVDAQAPGLAGLVRRLGQTSFYRDGWQSAYLDGLLDLYLLATGYKNREGLPGPLQQELRNFIGFTQSAEELKQQQGVTDNWLVLAKQVSDEDNLTVERIWLHGLGTGRPALVLQFLVRGQGGGLTLAPGSHLQAELVFYPGALPLRALVKSQTAVPPGPPPVFFAGWEEVVHNETALFARMPVRGDRPYLVAALTPVPHAGKWWLKDARGGLMPVKENFSSPHYTLLSYSGGRPLPMAVLGKEGQYEPVGLWYEGTYKPL